MLCQDMEYVAVVMGLPVSCQHVERLLGEGHDVPGHGHVDTRGLLFHVK